MTEQSEVTQPCDSVVEVTRADREAAEAWRRDYGRAGSFQDLLKAFARHRIAALAAQPSDDELLREAREDTAHDDVSETGADLLKQGWQHVAYYDAGKFHWMSGHAPRDCELYARIDAALATTTQPEMLMSQEWLDKKIAADPDDAECEAGPDTQGKESDRDRLSRFFREERPDLGFEGDVEGMNPVESAMHFLRRKQGDER